MPTAEAMAFLAEVHEDDHFVVLLASPLGLLLWRTESVQVVDGLWFARRLQESGVTNCAGGLDRWFADSANRRRVLDTATRGRLSPHKPPLDAQTALATIDDYLAGLRAARATRELLVGRSISPHATIGDFLRVANAGHRYLATRSDIPPHHWLSRLDPATPLYGDAPINALHLLEAMARLRELDMLRLHDVPASAIEAWESRMIQGLYEPVITSLRSAGLHSVPARNLCAAALGGVLDPALVPRGSSSVFVEDELPWFRFARLLDTYRHGAIHHDDLRERSAVEWLCHEEGLNSPSATMEEGARSQLLGPGANWNPVQQSGVGIKLLEYFEEPWLDVFDWFQRSFVAQSAAWHTHTVVEPDLPRGPRVYDDIATLLPQSDADDALVIEIMRWRRRILSEHVRGFVEGRPVAKAEVLASKVEAGMTARGLPREQIRWIRDVVFLDRQPVVDDRAFSDFVQPAVIGNSLTFIRS
jgi:hypothetical protein